MSNKFCRFLSNGYKINVDGQKLLWSPCCHYTKKVELGSDDFQKELAYTSNATGWLPECQTCAIREPYGADLFSPTRKNSLVRIPKDSNLGDCVNLEISFDIKCNAACASCGSWCSSLWGAINNKNNDNAKNFSYKFLTSTSDLLLQKLIDNVPLDKLRTVVILGGEPFFSDAHLKLLSHINNVHPDPSKIRLMYKTNGSIYPSKEDQKYWHLYKDIVISFSIDGIDEQFNYLRWPLKWEKVEQVIKQFVALEKTNVKLCFTNTISPLNLLYWNDLEKWVGNNVPRGVLLDPNILVYPNRCEGELDLSYAPIGMRHIITNQYDNTHNLNKFLSAIQINSNFKGMLTYLRSIDRARDLNWKNVFFKAVEFLQ